MDVSRPYTAISRSLEGAVLTVLAGTTRPLTVRDISRMVDRGSFEGVRQALARLADQGLAEVDEAGRTLLYRLNREHIAAPLALALAGLRNELLGRLRRAIEQWDVSPIHASLFGSAARADGNTDSDIDIFIVRPAEVAEEDSRWRAQIDELADAVRRWTGNHAGIAEVSGDEDLYRLAKERPPLAAELRRDAITLAGPSVTRLLRVIS